MRRAPARGLGFSKPNTANDDQVADLITTALAELARPDGNELVAFLDFWRQQSSQERALFAKSVKPDQTGQQVFHKAGDVAECAVDDAIGRCADFETA
jgi:hypothetical protein